MAPKQTEKEISIVPKGIPAIAEKETYHRRTGGWTGQYQYQKGDNHHNITGESILITTVPLPGDR